MCSEKSDKAHITWDSKNVFAGTAWFYARYRPDYPAKVFQLLREKFHLNKQSRVLDLGCGTGQIALKLAPYVAEVIAIDPLEEMLKEGKELATASQLRNINWLIGESTYLKNMASMIGEIDITVIGTAFHWMDRTQTLNDLYRLTKAGGGVCIVGGSAPRFKPDVLWIKAIDDTVEHWLGKERKAGTSGTFAPLPKRHEEKIAESEFQGLEIVDIPVTRKWTIDQIIGYLYSASPTSLPVLGEKKEPFEADLRKKLAELEPTGRFVEKNSIDIMMAWKPLTEKA
jgi:ubiquinone/menaquinone biosynthesis C-methylase UbiE